MVISVPRLLAMPLFCFAIYSLQSFAKWNPLVTGLTAPALHDSQRKNTPRPKVRSEQKEHKVSKLPTREGSFTKIRRVFEYGSPELREVTVTNGTEVQKVNRSPASSTQSSSQAGSFYGPALDSSKGTPSLRDQLLLLVGAKDDSLYRRYLASVDSNDQRLGRGSITGLMGWMNQRARSNFGPRDLLVNAPLLQIQGDLWLTTGIGFSGSYGAVVGADVDSVVGNSRYRARQDWAQIALQLRQFSSTQESAPYWISRLIFSDYRWRGASEDPHRPSWRTSGFGIDFTGHLPRPGLYTHSLGVSFFPSMGHTEDRSGTQLSSGADPQASRIGIAIGGDYSLSDSYKFLWRLRMENERNSFSGSSSGADPATGSIPSGSAVSTTWTIFSVGVSWGK